MLHLKSSLLLLPLTALGPVLADYLGASYPPPSDLTSDDSLINEAWLNFTNTLEEYFEASTSGDDSADPEQDLLYLAFNLTFSTGMFSLHDDEAAQALQFHHTSEEVATNEIGTNEVNGDSIYRLQSITKVFSAYAGLMNFGIEDWHRPLTEIFPELAEEIEGLGDEVPVKYVDWEQVTPWSMVNHLTGFTSNGNPIAGDSYFAAQMDEASLEAVLAAGFPPPDPEDPTWKTIACQNAELPCFLEEDAWVETMRPQPQAFEVWQSPMYSNSIFSLMGQVFERVLNRTVVEIFQQDILEPLNMTNSRIDGLEEDELKNAVITGNLTEGYLGDPVTLASGGVISSVNDLAKFGLSILNSTLLPANTTRKWLKPRTHTAHLDISVGAPWEIIRFVHPDTGVVTDLYTKSGDGFTATSSLILIPDFGVGFTVLTINSDDATRTPIAAAIIDLLIGTMLPALTAQAAAETQSKLGGTYVSTIDGLNSTISFAVNTTAGAPQGLVITEFISNSTDVIEANQGTLPTRLVPSGFDGNRILVRGLLDNDVPSRPEKYMTKLISGDWIATGADIYGGLPIRLFVFETDDDGKATSVSPVAYRVTLEREKEEE